MALIPTKITARIDYWESKGLSKMKTKTSKTYKETVQKLSWLINRKYIFEGEERNTMLDFRTSVDRFALQTFDSNYLPINKAPNKKVTLSQFLFNKFASPGFHCRYKFFLDFVPAPIGVKNGKTFNLLLSCYLKSSGNGIKSEKDLSQSDFINLSRTSNRIHSFITQHKNKLDANMAGTSEKLIKTLIEASQTFVKHDKTRFTTGLLARKWVWERFPNYLDQKGYLIPERPFSIYN
jgi:hypothetical protein